MTDGSAGANIDAAARFVAGARGRNTPSEVVECARRCVVDWFAVALGAHREAAAVAVRKAARSLWPGGGRALVLLDDPAPPAAAALINGTQAHCLDYDDTHVGSFAHMSGATLAAALAVGTDRNADEAEILTAFVAGFEVGARFGGAGLGQAANERGWHSTGVFACLGAAATSAVLHGLDENGVRRALGAAATQTGGLTASFGTMAKPFHAGKAALNGVIAADLAAAGFVPATGLLEPDGALGRALVQDGATTVPRVRFDGDWEITRNTFKPYASCLLTHPVIDAARSLSTAVRGREIAEVKATVSPYTKHLAGKERPRTPLEAKFSTAYSAALGLSGYAATHLDFSTERLADAGLRALTERVSLAVADGMPETSAKLEVRLADGEVVRKKVPVALGNPENPMSWDDMRTKFLGLVEPVVGKDAAELFNCLRGFGEGGRLERAQHLLGLA